MNELNPIPIVLSDSIYRRITAAMNHLAEITSRAIMVLIDEYDPSYVGRHFKDLKCLKLVDDTYLGKVYIMEFDSRKSGIENCNGCPRTQSGNSSCSVYIEALKSKN